MAKFILDTRLSEANYVLCAEAIRRGIIEPEDHNEGRRTMGEQRAFWNTYQRNGWPVAAFPSPLAPHIKLGVPNHAIDGNVPAIKRLAAFYQSYGVPIAFNVAGEDWHMDVLSAVKLLAAARRIKRERAARDRRELHKGEHSNEVKWIKHQLHYINDPDTRAPYFARHRSKPPGGWGTLFDDDLKGAVRRFQADRRMKVDGVIGPKTERKIDAAYKRARKRRRKK